MNDKYFIVTDKDILLNNKPTKYCNGIEITNIGKVIEYFNISRIFFFKEFNIKIKEFHLAQANNMSYEPIIDDNGNFSWIRIKDENNNTSDWVLTDFYTIFKSCSTNMFIDSANLLRSNSAFRFGLVKTLPNYNIKKINLVF